MLLTALALLREDPDPSEAQVRERLGGNLCRCTGYRGIVAAVCAAASTEPDPPTPGGTP
jgi:aerobic carbon-monoxide dehydrogenase small subunit